MTNQFRILQRRFGDARPGLQLIAVENAAIPVTVVRAEVLAQERKDLPITEEFTLRFVGLGVDTPDKIATYLGLEPAHVLDAAAEQLRVNHLRRNDSGNRLALTPVGTEVARTLSATQPVIQQLQVSFDRLSWNLADYPERALIKKQVAKDRGMYILPPAQSARIGLNDVTPQGFKQLLRSDRLQVLRVRKIEPKNHLYLPVQLLIYGDHNRQDLQLAVCIEDDLAVEHGLALERVNAVERLGLTLGEAPPRPVLDEDLENQRVTSPQPDASPTGDDAESSSSGLTSLVCSVSVFEHADLLNEALATAKKRLLIMAPWVRNAVVTTEFLAQLERRLKTGVEVIIAHGYGDDDSGSDPNALKRLSNLARRYEKFTFVRVRNTHAKILIFDDHWINTSFNWLSFRGDKNRTYRMEEGTLVNIPHRVQKEYKKYIQHIHEQRVDEEDLVAGE